MDYTKIAKEILDSDIYAHIEGDGEGAGLTHRENFWDAIEQHCPRFSGSSAAELVVNQGVEYLMTLAMQRVATTAKQEGDDIELVTIRALERAETQLMGVRESGEYPISDEFEGTLDNIRQAFSVRNQSETER